MENEREILAKIIHQIAWEEGADPSVDRILDAGFRLDPYPNGKSKPELIAIIEVKQAELDRARNLLREEHGTVNAGQGQSWMTHLTSNPDCPDCTFLAETSTVKS